WEWDGATWSQVSTTGPSPRSGGGIVYDEARSQLVLFGGTGPNGEVGDTWLRTGMTWAQALADAGAAPSARVGAGLAWDPVRQKAVLFGGTQGFNGSSETWEWNGGA